MTTATPEQKDVLRDGYLLLLAAAREDLEGAHHLVAGHEDPRRLVTALVGIAEDVGLTACAHDRETWIGHLTENLAKLDPVD